MLAAVFAGSLTAYAQSAKNFVANEPINVQQLNDFEWYVREASDAQGRSLADFSKNPNVQLQFKDGQLAVSGGCNNFSTSYQLDSQSLNISLGRIAGTKMACVPELMAQDEAIKKVIDNNKLHLGWFISKKKDYGELNLRMENEQGDHLLLAFEQPETIAFLEISNESKLCRSNEKSCPLVREITYDDLGNKTKIGEWRTWQGYIIEGWQFNPRERQILRLKFYRSKRVIGGMCNSSLPRAVLDKIVEREIVQ